MFTVSVDTYFWASHRLTLPDGSKEPAHSHNWRVTANVSSDRLDGMGLVMDFGRLKAMMDEVPLQIDQIVTDIASGKMHLDVSSDQIEGLVPSIRELGALLAIGMVAAASIVAAALLIIPHFGETTLRGIPVLPVIAAGMAVYAGF